jgi:hypothetical protein
MAAVIEAFKRGDEVLSKFPGSSIMTVLAVDGLKVRCRDGQDFQYWFDAMMLERYEGPQKPGEASATGDVRVRRHEECEGPVHRNESIRLSAALN